VTVRIHLIGIPSAGKTTLSEALGESLHIPQFALDALAFTDERWTPRPAVERDAMLAEILNEPSFITEGGFLGWTARVLEEVDVIIWLDPPLRVLVWRHVLRFAHHPWRIPSLLKFQILSYTRPADKGPAKDDAIPTRSGIEAALRPWHGKVLRVHRGVRIEEVLAYLADQG
jgi:hypothetical protein